MQRDAAGKKTMKEDTMWPEKIAAIYLQFPGLEQAFARNNVDRAYVSRFEESTLDLSTLTEEQPEGEFGTALTFYVSIMFLDPRGQCIVLGQETYLRCFLFWKYEAVRRFDQTVRQAIQKLPAGSTASHVVLVYHNGSPYYPPVVFE